MSSKRPVFLQLHQISLPLPALSSIIHRVTGLAMVLTFPIIACLVACSLQSEESFLWVQKFIQESFFISFLLWGLGSVMLYHLCSGIRHLFMDLHFFEELESARASAIGLFMIYFIVLALFSFWFWG
jgi:succinate dehydrogenase / fumarate reductase cytochrome b subunit